ncbi:efflux RND transporter periplasmic adaptor subunit [Dyadobacter sp. 32]|uniref:efflux RND transporter periplasmic adaptor subunit n=1 Tax=Dyadobacter sp. 32 TaxID=538966 RepID=UPI0011ECC958
MNLINNLLYCAVLLATLWSCGTKGETKEQTQPLKKLPVITLRDSNVTVTSDFPARIEGRVNVDIRSQADGYIEKIFVEEGAQVRAGQSLFKIVDAPYLQQLNLAKANLGAANAALKSAALEVEKFSELSRSGVTSDFQLKTANAAYEAAQANVALHDASVQSAKINLDFTLIKAPVSGFIGRIPKRVGNLVSKTDVSPMTTLTDIGEVYAYFSMTEKDFLTFNQRYPNKTLPQILAVLPPVSLQLADGKAYGLTGEIQMVDGQFDSSTGAISLRAMFKNPRYILRSGNTGRVILGQVQEHVLLVPARATVDMQDKIFAYRLTDKNYTERVAFTVSGKSGDYYLVKKVEGSEGLCAADRIVAREAAMIIEGEQIEPEK